MAKSEFGKKWITENSIEVVSQYEDGMLTLRALHYQLVGLGMTNDLAHYKKVVSAMIDARWEEKISFDTFSDLDRAMVGKTSYEETNVDEQITIGKQQIRAWMNNYHKNRWENQPNYVEVFIEKKALQGVFTNVCDEWNVGLGACKGYPSLTFLNETAKRLKEASWNKECTILYFGDYDASGEDIPRSIQENMIKFGVDVNIKRIALLEEQVLEWKLPHAPTKETDTRAANFTGFGQVELDAVKPEQIIKLCKDAIEDMFDHDLYLQLLDTEQAEREQYQRELKTYVNNL